MKPKHNNKQKDILFILASSFVVVVAWVGFNLYHIYVTSTVSPDLQSKLVPIDGSFDTATIDKLKARQKLAPSFNKQTSDTQPASSPATLEPTPSQTPISSSINIVGQ
jgi:hypothetical protein